MLCFVSHDTARAHAKGGFVGPNCSLDCTVESGRCARGETNTPICFQNGTCNCKTGRVGDKCQFSCDASKDCSGHGQCNDTASSSDDLCGCDEHWYSAPHQTLCATECANGTSVEGGIDCVYGTCRDTNKIDGKDANMCKCLPGYLGVTEMAGVSVTTCQFKCNETLNCPGTKWYCNAENAMPGQPRPLCNCRTGYYGVNCSTYCDE